LLIDYMSVSDKGIGFNPRKPFSLGFLETLVISYTVIRPGPHL
jgi:hypothetical protein